MLTVQLFGKNPLAIPSSARILLVIQPVDVDRSLVARPIRFFAVGFVDERQPGTSVDN